MSEAVYSSACSRSELARFWPAILACFVAAVFGWGFGFSGASVYLAELQRLHGWSSALIASALTCYYLIGAVCLAWVHAALRRLGPFGLLAAATAMLGVGATLFTRSQQLWEMFTAAVPMAIGWAGCTMSAVPSVLALYFHEQRGLAISLALNGASAAGFTVAPILVQASQRLGVGTAVPLVAFAMLALMLPLLAIGLRGAQNAGRAVTQTNLALSAREAIRSWRFWSVALPFALALAAQVGLIVHLVSFLLPQLGASGAAMALALTSVAAMSGRLALATVIDRLNQRRTAATSFCSQAAGVVLMIVFPAQPWALYAGCIIFGLSVGNVITIPALIVQREFPTSAFGLVIGLSTAFGQFTFALSPALLGLVRDISGGYDAVLALCAALQLGGAALVLRPPRA